MSTSAAARRHLIFKLIILILAVVGITKTCFLDPSAPSSFVYDRPGKAEGQSIVVQPFESGLMGVLNIGHTTHGEFDSWLHAGADGKGSHTFETRAWYGWDASGVAPIWDSNNILIGWHLKLEAADVPGKINRPLQEYDIRKQARDLCGSKWTAPDAQTFENIPNWGSFHCRLRLSKSDRGSPSEYILKVWK